MFFCLAMGVACDNQSARPSGSSEEEIPAGQAMSKQGLSDRAISLLCETSTVNALAAKPFPFQTSDIPQIQMILADTTMHRCWLNALHVLAPIAQASQMLAIIRSQLRVDVADAIESGVSSATFTFLPTSAVRAVGIALRFSPQDESLLQFLRLGANPGYWLAQDLSVVRDARLVRASQTASKVATEMAYKAVEELAMRPAAFAKLEMESIRDNSSMPSEIREYASSMLQKIAE